jgi:hypothetical protein
MHRASTTTPARLCRACAQTLLEQIDRGNEEEEETHTQSVSCLHRNSPRERESEQTEEPLTRQKTPIVASSFHSSRCVPKELVFSNHQRFAGRFSRTRNRHMTQVHTHLHKHTITYTPTERHTYLQTDRQTQTHTDAEYIPAEGVCRADGLEVAAAGLDGRGASSRTNLLISSAKEAPTESSSC